jgi:thioredoxin 1
MFQKATNERAQGRNDEFLSSFQSGAEVQGAVLHSDAQMATHFVFYAMKNLSIVLIAAAIFIGRAASAEVHFREAGFEDAKKLAAKEHKKIMVDFYTSWCGWCKVLDRKTYSDENVGKLADAKFISIKIDAEHGEGVELAKYYAVRGYPTIIFLKEDGSLIDKVVGYQDAEHFARSLQLADAGGSKAVIDEINSAHPPADPAKWAIAADYYLQRKDNVRALGAYHQMADLDPENKSHMREEAMYGIAYLTEGDAQYEALEKALAEFPMREEGQRAAVGLIEHYFTLNKPEDAARIIDKWAMNHPDDAQSFNAFAWYAAQHKQLLDKADTYVKRAIGLAKDASEKAGFMDTQAELAYRSGHKDQALAIENQAIALLDPQKDHRMLEQLTREKAKYDGTIVDLEDETAQTQQSEKPKDTAKQAAPKQNKAH